MPEAQTNIEEDEIDDAKPNTADAADVGGDKNGEEENLPDYEVVEEDDARLAKEKNPATKGERRTLTTKEKRDLKKKRIQEGFNSRDAIIYQQNQKLQELESWKNQIEGRLTNVDKQKVDENINQAAAVFNAAEKNLEAAFTEGDGAKHTKATKDMYAAQKAIEYWQNIKQQYAAAAIAPRQAAAAGPDPRILAKKEAFEQRHSDWYNPEGGDEDSEIAKGISNALIKQKFDPASDDFWDELEDRLAERGITADEQPKAPVRRRASPPVGGGSGRADVAGKVRVTLPSQYVQYCKDIGKWDNEADKKRMIKRYLDTQKANEA